MLHVQFEALRKGRAVSALRLGVFLAALLYSLPTAAQQPQGPLKPPPVAAPRDEPKARPPAPAAAKPHRSSGITDQPPAIPVDQIIQKFAERESEFKKERENYTYVQTFVVQTIDLDGQPDGEHRMTSDILFTPLGKRYEKIIYAPAPTLQRISLSQQDLDDLRLVQPFVLTTEEMSKYDIHYVGREGVDEITTYVFDVAPKKIEKNQRYFQGRIWVDDKDLEIVKSYGKAVPDIKKGNNENFFPRFETYRENIEKNFWFPTYTHADDVLHFRGGDVRIRMTVRYADYKRFRATGRILSPSEVPQDRP